MDIGQQKINTNNNCGVYVEVLESPITKLKKNHIFEGTSEHFCKNIV